MSGYPDSDELNYGDELDLLCEQDEDVAYEPPSKSRKSLDFTSPDPSGDDRQQKNHRQNRSFENDIVPIESGSFTESALPQSVTQETVALLTPEQRPQSDTSTKKRPVQELLDEIDTFLSSNNWSHKQKKYKTNRTEMELIDYIVEMRNFNSKMSNPFGRTNASNESKAGNIKWDKNNMSKNVPRFPFISIHTHDEDRIYIRCHSEDYMKREMADIKITDTFKGVMGETFKDVWKEANDIINKSLESERVGIDRSADGIGLVPEAGNELWVDLYKPKNYVELLSDESTNRTLLKWMKLWDAVVFNRRPRLKMKTEQTTQNKWNIEMNLKVGEDKLPQYKVILLCGPPGLGKTTLAHIVAKHAGYNIVEVNASDDRSIESFKKSLEDATQMCSYIDPKKRPNCLIFDEIDGAPPSSIEYLVKFITGTAPTKVKKGKKQKQKLLKRPIICICNELYVPALRPLRQIALIINFPPTGSARLAERLIEISKLQHIKTDLGAVLALCDKTDNDIRSCLSVLYFFKTQKKLSLTDVYKTNIGLKDKQKHLFNVWRSIFQIERKKTRTALGAVEDDMSLKVRMRRVLESVTSFGDYDRLCQGVFENYSQVFETDTFVEEAACDALEWFTYYDTLNKRIHSTQNYSLSSYTPYAFVVWHFAFAKLSNPKLNYPSAGSEARSKLLKSKGIISEILKGMSPASRVYSGWRSLVLDTLPFVSLIITPNFRPVNFQLFTEQEKKDFQKIVSVMIDCNLNYVQERNADGRYTYNLDPNIDDVISFSDSKMKPKILNSNAQLLSREIEVEKMRRIHGCPKIDEKTKNKTTDRGKTDLPNHLQTLNVKEIKTKSEAVPSKDFFGRTIVRKDDDEKQSEKKANHIWYCYKEGYSNAVRRKIKVSSLK